jgi:N4-gp56 family major capsid protein
MADTLAGFNSEANGFDQLVQVAIYRDVIRTLRTQAHYAMPESVLPLQRMDGNNLSVRATLWTDVAPDLTALAEGTPPSPTKMAEDQVTASLTEVGGYIPIFSQAAYQLDQLVMQATDKVGRQIYLAFDTFARKLYADSLTDAFAGTANTQTSGIGAGDVLTTALIDEMVTRARESDLEPFADGLYRIVGHPRAFAPLLSEVGAGGGMTGFAPAASFGSAGDLVTGTIGGWHGGLFVSAGSRGIKIATGDAGADSTLAAVDVYKIALVGRSSIALTNLNSVQTIVQQGGGPTDPLRQIVATVGWRGFMGGVLVDAANFSDGAGTLDASIKRSVTAEVAAV